MEYDHCSKNTICGLVSQVDEAIQVYVERNTTPSGDPHEDTSVSRFMMGVIIKYGRQAEFFRSEVPSPPLRCEGCIYNKINPDDATR